MFVEQEGGEPAPRFRISVRNTFVHVDEEADGDEETPAPHVRGGRRSKTGPAGMQVFCDVSDDGEDESDGSGAGSAGRPREAAAAQEGPAVCAATAQAAATAGGPASPAVLCMPVSLQAGLPPPLLTDMSTLGPLLAQLSAQAARLGQPAGPWAAPAPEAARAAAPGATAVGAPRRSGADRTTVLLQNLPLNYRRPMLLRMLDAEGFSGQYDFVYLPMDFRTRAGFGYAFINLTDASVVPRFWSVFEGYKKWMFPSAKVCRVSWSVPHQGLKAHIKRYRNSPLMHESVPDEYRPALFSGGARVPFPPPTKELAAPSQKVLAKAPKGSRRPAAA